METNKILIEHPAITPPPGEGMYLTNMGRFEWRYWSASKTFSWYIPHDEVDSSEITHWYSEAVKTQFQSAPYTATKLAALHTDLEHAVDMAKYTKLEDVIPPLTALWELRMKAAKDIPSASFENAIKQRKVLVSYYNSKIIELLLLATI